MLPEKKIETDIKKYLEIIGAYFVKIHGSAYMPAGTPDILVCYKGRFIAIEVKKQNGGVVSPLQKLKLKQVTNAGGIAFVARSKQDVVDVLRHHRLLGGE